MQINVLMVNYNTDAQRVYNPLLSGQGIIARPALSMEDALNMLLDDEYSGIVINADSFDYLSLLRVMRALTYAPIGISSSKYDLKENDEAIDKGADVYRLRYDEPRHRATGFSALVKICREHDIRYEKPLPFISCGDVRILTGPRRAFVKNRELDLMRKEFDLLCYLVRNKGLVVSHEQILRKIWGNGYEDSTRETLWNQVSQLRNKLRVHLHQPDYIRTVRGVGYVFDPNPE